jgi:hypothetical protein
MKYRFWGGIGALIGLNLAVAFLKLPLQGNFLDGNLLTDSIMVMGLIGLLADMKIVIPERYRNNYIVLGIIAFIVGIGWQVLSFGSLLIAENSSQIISQWISIAPIVIGFIGIPCLYISYLVSKERVIWGQNATGWKGLIFVSAFCSAYTIAALYFLTKFGWLVI